MGGRGKAQGLPATRGAVAAVHGGKASRQAVQGEQEQALALHREGRRRVLCRARVQCTQVQGHRQGQGLPMAVQKPSGTGWPAIVSRTAATLRGRSAARLATTRWSSRVWCAAAVRALRGSARIGGRAGGLRARGRSGAHSSGLSGERAAVKTKSDAGHSGWVEHRTAALRCAVGAAPAAPGKHVRLPPLTLPLQGHPLVWRQQPPADAAARVRLGACGRGRVGGGRPAARAPASAGAAVPRRVGPHPPPTAAQGPALPIRAHRGACKRPSEALASPEWRPWLAARLRSPSLPPRPAALPTAAAAPPPCLTRRGGRKGDGAAAAGGCAGPGPPR